MARQWLKKSDIDKWSWKTPLLDSVAPAGIRTAIAAEAMAKVFLLVIVNMIFLLAALRVLHSRGDLYEHGDLPKCVHDTLPNSAQYQAHSLPRESRKAIVLTLKNETQLSNPINIRHFDAYGVAVHLFIKMSAHRGGPNSFAIVGLEAKEPAALYYNPPYECVWVPAPGSTKRKPIKGHAFKMLPDPENTYSRLYSAVTVNCTFNEDVGIDREGGQLVLYASYGELFPRKSERIVVLTEDAGEFKGMQFYKSDSFEYDCVYCGSPLFGDLSPQRIREWMAYHAHFFGPRSHFFLYDAGGIHEDVRRVLKPWIAAGRITLDDIREQEQYDGYYHNQFMVVNDCFHRARHLSRWLFFFDVDEYMWIPPSSGTLESILAGFEHQTQIIMWQKPMSRSVCLEEENSATDRLESKWAFEKLVYQNVRKREVHDCKYAIQGRKAMSTAIHRSSHLIGINATVYAHPIRYYHYHKTINRREEVCQEFVPSSKRGLLYRDPKNTEEIFLYDGGMKELSGHIKEFELDAIGPQPFIL